MDWKKIPDKNINSVDQFKDLKPARISKSLYEFERTRWKMGVHATRLLLMVSQTVSKSEPSETDLYPLEYPLDIVFKYLGLESTNKRYDVLAEALEEVMSKPLCIKTTTKRGATRWVGVAFLSKYEFATDYPSLRIKVCDDAREFLCQLHQYALVQPKYYLKLSTDYQNWFYPYLKLRKMLGSWEVEIKDLLFMLYLEKTPSYTTDQKANSNFFKYVIGIEKPKGWKYNKSGKNKPWDYIRDKNGEFTGTISTITRETDINVSAFPIMEKGKYTKLHFDISVKSVKLSKQEKEQIHTKALNEADNDMGKPTRYGRTKKIQTVKDLFSSVPIIKEEPNPLAATDDIPQGKTVISAHVVVEMARLAGKRVTDFAKQMGYTARKDGNWEKEL